MHRRAWLVIILITILSVVTGASGRLVSAPIAASWPAWWPVWSGFALIAILAVHAAWQRPQIARVTALRAGIAWLAWAMPALIYGVVGGHYGLPPLRANGEVVVAAEIGHWLDRLAAYSLLGATPTRDPLAQLGPTLGLVAVYGAPWITVLMLVSMWRSSRRGGPGRA